MLKVERAYELKFYLNAQHYIVIDGARGETHPHTWEFILTIKVSGQDFTPFSTFEKGISDYLAPYQNQVLNDIAPFDDVLPTLENLTEYFAEQMEPIIASVGGRLERFAGSEGPTRSYVLTLTGDETPESAQRRHEEELDGVIDAIVSEELA